MDNLFTALWHDFELPDFWWQVGVLLLCLGIAKLAEHYIIEKKLSEGHAVDRTGALAMAACGV